MPQTLLQAEDCLVRCYPSTQKGGTLIAEEVGDQETHALRICNPDGYRPGRCPTCGHSKLHVLDYPERVLLAEGLDSSAKRTVIRIVRYLCVGCSASWRILPRFLARYLWRSWAIVEERVLDEKPPPNRPKVPATTVWRWKTRVLMTALVLTQALAMSGSPGLETVAKATGLEATRAELLANYERSYPSARKSRLGNLAALIHRLVPGVRLM